MGLGKYLAVRSTNMYPFSKTKITDILDPYEMDVHTWCNFLTDTMVLMCIVDVTFF
jgi:hypothetical protein